MKLKVSPIYEKNWLTTKKIVVNRGGTRSGKTYNLEHLLVTWLFSGYIRKDHFIPKGIASVVRKYKETLRTTAQRDFETILKTYNLYQHVRHNKVERTYSFDGRTVEFFGADNEQKIRGATREILFCNEANELGFKKEFFQLLIRTKEVVFIDFNPSDPYTWINTEIEQKRAIEKGDVDVIVSTYKDNPFLQKSLIEEIEYLQHTDKELWQVYGLGQYGKVTGLVFPDVTIIQDLPDATLFDAYGQDFGFSNDVSATVRGGVIGQNLYLDEVIYETGLTNTDLSRYYESVGLRKGVDQIWADAAEPKTIEELRRMRWKIKAAKKGRDSVRFGIQLLKKYKIHITARSVNFQKEQKTYKYKQLPDGDYTNEPIDLNNHLWDASRYYAVMELGKVSRLPKFANG